MSSPTSARATFAVLADEPMLSAARLPVRAVAWLCQASEAAGEDAEEWVATIDEVIAILQEHRYTVTTRGKGVRGRDDAAAAVAD